MATHGRPQAAPAPEEYSLFRRRGPWKDALRRRMLAVADALTFLFAIAVAGTVESHNFALWALALLPLWLLLAKIEGLYDRDQPKIWYLTIDEAPALVHWITVSVAATSLIMAAVLEDGWLSAKGAALMWVVALIAAIALRSAARNLWRRMVPPERGLVIGSGQLATAVRRKLKLEPGHHMAVVGYTGTPSSGNGNGSASGENGHGNGNGNGDMDAARVEELDQADLEELIVATGAERVILAAPELDEPTLARVVQSCRSLGVKLSVTPPMRAMLGTAVELSHIAELPVIEYRTGNPSRSTMALKRVLDVCGGLDRPGRAHADHGHRGRDDPARLARAGPLHPAARGPEGHPLPHPQVPHHGAGRGGPHLRGGVDGGPERADVQAARRPANHPPGPLPTPDEPRRAAPADQRGARAT